MTPVRTDAILGFAALTSLAAPAAAHAGGAVRFVHAVPGAGTATLRAGGVTVGAEGFGGVSRYAALSGGAGELTLVAGGRTLARAPLPVTGDRRYTVVALLRDGEVALATFPDERAKPGVAKLRVIHAVPELGAPQIWVDGKKVLDRLAYRSASPYLTVKGGRHTYAAKSASGGTLLSGTLDLRAGTASTGIVVGSRGEKVHLVPALDDSAKAAPKPKRKAAPGGGSASYTVRAGDSLWSIARRRLGAHASDAAIARRLVRIWNANARRIGTGNPDLIRPGTRLRLP
jgi:hypothetical protein